MRIHPVEELLKWKKKFSRNKHFLEIGIYLSEMFGDGG